jgi:hypothetical protein
VCNPSFSKREARGSRLLGSYLEDDSASRFRGARVPALISHAVKVACGVHSHTRHGKRTIRGSGETV